MQFLQCYFTFWLGLEFVNVISDAFFLVILLLYASFSEHFFIFFLIGNFDNCSCLLVFSGKPAAMMYLCASQFHLRHVVWTQTSVVTATFAEGNESSQTLERTFWRISFCRKIEDDYVNSVEYSAKQLRAFILLIMWWMR